MLGCVITFRSVIRAYSIVCFCKLMGEMENNRRAQLKIKRRLILDKPEIESWSPKMRVGNMPALNEIFKYKD